MDQNNEDYTEITPKCDSRSFQPRGHDWSFLVRAEQVLMKHRDRCKFRTGQGLGSRSPGGWYLRGFSFQVSNDWNRIGVTVTMQFPGWTFRLMILEFSVMVPFSDGRWQMKWYEMCKMPLTDEFPIGSGDFLQIASVPRFEILSPWYDIPAFYGSKCTVSPAKAWFLRGLCFGRTGEGIINWSLCWIPHWSQMSENRGHHFQPVSALSPASAGDSGLPKRLRLVTS